MIPEKTANQMLDAMIETIDREIDRETPSENAEWVLRELYPNQLRAVRSFLRSFKQVEEPPRREPGFYWVKPRGQQSAWPTVQDCRQAAYFDGGSWYFNHRFWREDELEAIGARLPDDFDGTLGPAVNTESLRRVLRYYADEYGGPYAAWCRDLIGRLPATRTFTLAPEAPFRCPHGRDYHWDGRGSVKTQCYRVDDVFEAQGCPMTTCPLHRR